MSDLRFGIIGAGVIGNIHARVIHQIKEASLAGIADLNEDAGKRLSGLYNCKYYSDYKLMLKNNDLDVVCICLPSGLHYQAVLDAAEAKNNIIVEKPIEVTEERAQKMVEKCAKEGVKFSVIFQHRFDKDIVCIKKYIKEGKLGKIYFGSSRTIWYRGPEYYKNAGWRGTWKLDGGAALMNQSIHYIDLLQYIMGPVKAVCGLYDTLRHKYIEAEDIGIALVKFKSGAIGTIEGTTLAYPGFDAELNVFGENGSIFVKNNKMHGYKSVSGKEEKFEQIIGQKEQPILFNNYDLTSHIAQFKDVIKAIKQDSMPSVTGEQGMEALKIIKAIYKSSQDGQWVEIQ